jgi:hypothetical protein
VRYLQTHLVSETKLDIIRKSYHSILMFDEMNLIYLSNWQIHHISRIVNKAAHATHNLVKVVKVAVKQFIYQVWI